MFKLNLNSYAKVVVNGQTVFGNTKDVIKIDNGRVYVNDILIEGLVDFELTIKTSKDQPEIKTNNFNVTVYGNVNKVNTVGRVSVTGNTGKIDTTGRVEVGGDVNGNINTTGSVTCGKVSGNIDTVGKVTVN